MGFLSQVTHGVTRRPRRCVVYGLQGVGKSTFGAGAPKPIFLSIEDGLADIDCPKTPLLRSFADVMGVVNELYKDRHDYQTCVVDTIDWLETLIFQQVCADENATNIEKIGYAKGYIFALNHWKRLINGLEHIRQDRQMNIVLLAHARHEKFKLPGDEALDRYAPKIHKFARDLVCEWADEVLFATYSSVTNPSKVKVKGEPDRLLMTRETPIYQAKSRLRMPDSIEMKWAAYESYMAQPDEPEAPNTPNTPDAGEER